MLVVGEKEAEDGTVAVREHGKGDIGTMTIENFAKLIQTTIDNDFKQKTNN
jgi:threonyl-tRNA synthetase